MWFVLRLQTCSFIRWWALTRLIARSRIGRRRRFLQAWYVQSLGMDLRRACGGETCPSFPPKILYKCFKFNGTSLLCSPLLCFPQLCSPQLCSPLLSSPLLSLALLSSHLLCSPLLCCFLLSSALLNFGGNWTSPKKGNKRNWEQLRKLLRR